MLPVTVNLELTNYNVTLSRVAIFVSQKIGSSEKGNQTEKNLNIRGSFKKLHPDTFPAGLIAVYLYCFCYSKIGTIILEKLRKSHDIKLVDFALLVHCDKMEINVLNRQESNICLNEL